MTGRELMTVEFERLRHGVGHYAGFPTTVYGESFPWEKVFFYL